MEVEVMTDLETMGIVVVRGFLSSEEVRLLQGDYNRVTPEDNLNFYSTAPSADVMARLTRRFNDVLRQVNEATTVRVDAGHFVPVAGRWLATSDNRGGVRVINQDLEKLAVTPELAVGDLLLMRGDIIHRTQDAATARVALSWRAASGSTMVRRSRPAGGGVCKAQIMRKHAAPYQRMFDAFDSANKAEMRLIELLHTYAMSPTPRPVDARTFSGNLFHEKRQAHTLGSYVASIPETADLRGLYVAQQCSNRLGAARRRAAATRRRHVLAMMMARPDVRR